VPFGDNTNSRMTEFSVPSKSAPVYAAATENSREDTSSTYALGDVKNRLAQMQKNKQQLEEKLKHYESKIKNHFNSGNSQQKYA
jgi:uncharacterized protein YlxW (UPF0749 family)